MNGIAKSNFRGMANKRIIRAHYDSRSAFVRSDREASDVNKHIWKFVEGQEHRTPESRKEWYGVSEISEIIEIGRKGWIEGVSLYQKLKDSISIDDIAFNAGFAKKKRRKVFGQDGDEIDICRYINREWDTMYLDKKTEKVKGGKYITIWANSGGNANASPERIMWRGIAAVVLVDILENAGYRVALNSYVASRGLFIDSPLTNTDRAVTISLKAFDAPLDIENALVGGCPAFLRYYIFRENMARPERVCATLGHCHSDLPEEIIPNGDIVLGDINYLSSAEQAIQVVKRILAEISKGVNV